MSALLDAVRDVRFAWHVMVTDPDLNAQYPRHFHEAMQALASVPLEDAPAERTSLLYDKLQAHLGHGVTIASYDLEPNSADPHNISLECEDCGEVIVDTDAYELAGLPCPNCDADECEEHAAPVDEGEAYCRSGLVDTLDGLDW